MEDERRCGYTDQRGDPTTGFPSDGREGGFDEKAILRTFL